MGELFTTETLDLEIWVETLPVALVPWTRTFTPLRLSSTRCIINGYWQHTRWTSFLSRGGVAITLGMFHTNETGISYGCLGLWLTCTFTFNTFTIRKPVSFFSLRYDFYDDFLHQQGVTLSSGISYSRLLFCLNCHKIIV